MVIENEDELAQLVSLAARSGSRVPIALRLAPVTPAGRMPTRFGLRREEAVAHSNGTGPAEAAVDLTVVGVHFHLDGCYAVADRIAAIGEALGLVDALRERGHRPTFLDIGGGIPMSYLDSDTEWRRFWSERWFAAPGSSRCSAAM